MIAHTARLLLLLAPLVIASPARTGDPPLTPGGAVEGLMPREGSVTHVLRSDEHALVTLRAASFEFDAALRIERGDELVAEQDGGGVGQNARLAVELAPGDELRVTVAARDARGGAYRLAAEPGEDADPLATAPGSDAQIDYWATSAERARERGDRVRWLQSLNLAGQHAQAGGRLAKARDLFAEVLHAASAGEEGISLLACTLLGSVHLDLGGYDDAAAHLAAAERALEALRAHETRAFVLDRLVELYRATHELELAETLAAELLATARENGLPDREVRALAYAGNLAAMGGHPGAASALHREALRLASRRSETECGYAHYAFGKSLLLSGDSAGAAAELECAAELGLDPVRIDARLTLGSIERSRGHYWRAVEQLEQALDDGQACGGELRAHVLRELAVLERCVEDYPRADELLAEALVAARTARPAARVAVLRELANLREDQGDERRRRELLESAVRLATREGLLDDEARGRLSLGACLADAGRLDEAEREYVRALEAAHATGATALVAMAEADMAALSLQRSDSARALALAERACRSLEGFGHRFEALHALETVARAAIEQGDYTRAEDAVDRARETLLELASLDARREAGIRAREAWWAASLDQDLTRVRLAATPAPDVRAAMVRRGFERASEWKARRLHEGLTTSRGGTASRALDERLTAGLDTQTVLVEYVEGSENLLAYVLFEGRLELLDLGPHEGLAERVRSYVDAVLDPTRTSTAARALAEGTRLFRQVLLPPLSHASGASKLVVVASPSLAGLPFEALPVDAPRGAKAWTDARWVLEELVVAYAPSSTVLALLAERPPTEREQRVLIVADPDYDLGRARGSARTRALERLQGTRVEAAALAKLLGAGDAVRESLGARRDVVLRTPALTLCLGAEATPARLAEAAGYSIVHCAAHGIVDVNEPTRTGIVLSFAESRSGFVSVADVLDWDLDAELVVLSACDTARGRMQGGEGVKSMAYAFFGAGARSVVASLCRVDDNTSAQIMDAFYRRLLQDGLSAADALVEAKRSLLEERRAPELAATRGIPLRARPAAPDPAHPSAWASHVFVGVP